MKKHNRFPLLAVLLLATGLAGAQMAYQPVKANIPFDFMAGNRSLPAGEYKVAMASDIGVLSLIGGPTDKALVGSNAIEANAPSGKTKLIFHRYGDRYFLCQIWIEGESRGREVPQTRLEKELASNLRFSSVAVLAHR